MADSQHATAPDAAPVDASAEAARMTGGEFAGAASAAAPTRGACEPASRLASAGREKTAQTSPPPPHRRTATSASEVREIRLLEGPDGCVLTDTCWEVCDVCRFRHV